MGEVSDIHLEPIGPHDYRVTFGSVVFELRDCKGNEQEVRELAIALLVKLSNGKSALQNLMAGDVGTGVRTLDYA